MFNRRKKNLKNINSKKKIMFVTGYSAEGFLHNDIFPHLKDFNCTLKAVENKFWGKNVTVSGLLTGQDMLREAKMNVNKFETLVIPPNCLNSDNLFLDNMSLSQFQTALGKPVIKGSYNIYETLKEVLV